MPPHTADKGFACGKKIRFSNFEPLHRRARRDAQKAFQAGPPPLRRFYMGWVKGRSKGQQPMQTTDSKPLPSPETLNSKQNRLDVYQRVTNQIIEAIEQGVDAWQMPWHRHATTPRNALSGKSYRGVNVLSLWATAAALQYRSGIWATYAQWTELGAQVRKGEKSTLIVFWKFRYEDSETEESEEQQSKRAGCIARGYNVFNADQIDGYALPEVPALPEAQRIESADSFFSSLTADIRHGGGRAYYRKQDDYIQIPPFSAFQESAAYYATLAHESIHWTGSAQRLNRDLTGRFGNEAYAAEELVAELGAAFLCADLGISNQPRPDHAAYVQNWLTILRNDSRAIFTAASKSQTAADWLHAQSAAAVSPMQAEEHAA